MTDPIQDIFDTINQTVPAPKQQAENKAVFLATAHRLRVTSQRVARHQPMNVYNTKGEFNMSFNRKRMSVLVVLFAILMVAGAVFANSIFGFFNQADSDNSNLEVTVGELDTTQFTLANNAQLPAFFDNLAQAVASASYSAKVPTALPSGYQFTNATYHAPSGELFQNYQCDSANITFIQRPLADGESFGGIEVGASANIIPVNLGDGGEYVRGGWSTDGDTPMISLDGNTTTNIDLSWSNDLPQHSLMWTENGMMYSVQTSGNTGACNLTQADILAFANGLK